MEFQIAMTLSLSNSFIMTKKEKKKKKKKKKEEKKERRRDRPFPYIILLFGQFNMLQLSVSLYVKCVLVIGHCGRRNIKVPSFKTSELTNVFP